MGGRFSIEGEPKNVYKIAKFPIFSLYHVADVFITWIKTCRKHDYFVSPMFEGFYFCPQVYEHITYDNIKHISLASLPGMQDRTIITSSLSKTFSVTGQS